jgi:hypothetical protein
MEHKSDEIHDCVDLREAWRGCAPLEGVGSKARVEVYVGPHVEAYFRPTA